MFFQPFLGQYPPGPRGPTGIRPKVIRFDQIRIRNSGWEMRQTGDWTLAGSTSQLPGRDEPDILTLFISGMWRKFKISNSLKGSVGYPVYGPAQP